MMVVKYASAAILLFSAASADVASSSLSTATSGFVFHRLRSSNGVRSSAVSALHAHRRPSRESSMHDSSSSSSLSDDDVVITRRESLGRAMGTISASFGILSAISASEPANAFPNKISTKYDDRPKQRYGQPKNLGVGIRKDMVGDEYKGLKPCGPAPNCFCSTDSIEDDPEHSIPAWKFPSKVGGREAAFVQLKEAVEAYEPGQANIDGGGFSIVKFDAKAGYLYAQFESLKNGYVDDLEFAYVDNSGAEGEVQVRSSSRLGYLDYGVNAKRLNYLAKAMHAKGWDAPGVDLGIHRDYAIQNQMS